MPRKKGKLRQIIEFAPVYLLIQVSRAIPWPVIRVLSVVFSRLGYRLFSRRRAITLDNIRHALGAEKSESEISCIARESFRSLFMTVPEITKYQHLFSSGHVLEEFHRISPGLEGPFHKAKELHDASGGCIFVTPHLGNWEFLPHVSAAIGIPMVVVVRPLDNPWLERLIYTNRIDSGQAIIPKSNSMITLQRTLRQGKSVGLLPDQSISKGIPVPYFGRPAYTTLIPAMLSVMNQRPIVVTACCRTRGKPFIGVVCDPIWPEPHYESERGEIIRLTEAMNRMMETVVRRFPEQYFWMHNRWKSYG